MPKHIHHHYAPSVTLTHMTHHIVTHGFVDRPHWSDCTAGQLDGEAGSGYVRTTANESMTGRNEDTAL